MRSKRKLTKDELAIQFTKLSNSVKANADTIATKANEEGNVNTSNIDQYDPSPNNATIVLYKENDVVSPGHDTATGNMELFTEVALTSQATVGTVISTSSESLDNITAIIYGNKNIDKFCFVVEGAHTPRQIATKVIWNDYILMVEFSKGYLFIKRLGSTTLQAAFLNRCPQLEGSANTGELPKCPILRKKQLLSLAISFQLPLTLNLGYVLSGVTSESWATSSDYAMLFCNLFPYNGNYAGGGLLGIQVSDSNDNEMKVFRICINEYYIACRVCRTTSSGTYIDNYQQQYLS